MFNEAAFWSHIDQRLPHECWEWEGFRFPKGYGQAGVGIDGERTRYAHRIAYVLTFGPIPDELLVLHSCDNPPCCNPAHLFVGSFSENNLDMYRKGRGGDRASRGEANGSARLTLIDVEQIRQRYEAGETQVALAAAFGVVQTHISKIVRREVWQEASCR